MQPNELAEINRLNRDFWDQESARARARMEDPLIREHVEKQLRWEESAQVPVRARKTTEFMSAEAELLCRSVLRAQGRKGGKAEKTDPLQRLIEQKVAENPRITGPKLLEMLKNEANCGVIEEIDEEEGVISFSRADGTFKSAKVGGLKDRLSRAKWKMRSRKAD